MGARGKKRRRADGSVANGKSDMAKPVKENYGFNFPKVVPNVEPRDVEFVYKLLREEMASVGVHQFDDPGCSVAYIAVQEKLLSIYGKLTGDAILWRAGYLAYFMDDPHFREVSGLGSGQVVPSSDMFYVAANIFTTGADREFDRKEFALMMIDRSDDQHPSPAVE